MTWGSLHFRGKPHIEGTVTLLSSPLWIFATSPWEQPTTWRSATHSIPRPDQSDQSAVIVWKLDVPVANGLENDGNINKMAVPICFNVESGDKALIFCDTAK